MKRSHRLLRAVHALRLGRFDLATNPALYNAFAECASLSNLMRSAEGDGFFKSHDAVDATVAVVEGVHAVLAPELRPTGLAGRVAQSVLAAAVAGRSSVDGRPRLGGSDRSLAEGCAAIAQAAVIDRAYRAVAEVMRRRALVDHRMDPCWPEDYLRRRAQAREVEALVAGVAKGPSRSRARPRGSQTV